MPRVSVSFNEVAPPHSHELLESGHYDLLVQTEYGGQIDDGFTRATLYDLPLAVGARVGHPLRRAQPAAMHDALWLVPGNIESPSNLLRLAYAAHGLPPPRDVIPCQSIAVGLALIAESDALGIFVRDLFEHQLLPRPLRMVPLDHALPAARVCIVMRADSPPTPAARCFMDCLHAARRDMKMSTIAPVVNASSSKIPAKPPGSHPRPPGVNALDEESGHIALLGRGARSRKFKCLHRMVTARYKAGCSPRGRLRATTTRLAIWQIFAAQRI